MKITHVRTANEHFDTATPGDSVVTVVTRSWYESPVFWVSTATAIVGIIGVLQQHYPTLSWLATIGGIINVIVSTYQTILAQSSIVN
jgi:hypothetical protein